MYEIFVFNDYGSCESSVRQLDECARQIFTSATVCFITGLDIQNGRLVDEKNDQVKIEHRLLCIGGGFDLGYLKSLGELGCQQIRQFVCQGNN